MITQERLKELLSYDHETGIFARKVRASNSPKGKIVGTRDTNGHLQVRIDNKLYLCHRLAWLYEYGEFPSEQIDHINGIRHDNRISNLRNVSATVNAQNKRAAPLNNKSTKLLGVSHDKESGKFKAYITVFGKQITLGRFVNKDEAHQAYIEAKRKYHEGCAI